MKHLDSMGVQGDSNHQFKSGSGKDGGAKGSGGSNAAYSDSSSDGFDGKNVEDILYGNDEKEKGQDEED